MTLNPGIGPFNVPVSTTLPGIGTITISPVVFNAGDSSDYDCVPANGSRDERP